MKTISAHEVRKQLEEGTKLHIIDVREISETKSGKIPGAESIPLGLIEFKKQDLDKKQEYLVVCQSGGRSSQAVRYLEGYGYKVLNLEGGMSGWEGPLE